MCLAIPVIVEELRDNARALVELEGVRREVSIAMLEDVKVGDYVIVHVGIALNKLDPEEAAKTLQLFAEIASFAPPHLSEKPA